VHHCYQTAKRQSKRTAFCVVPIIPLKIQSERDTRVS